MTALQQRLMKVIIESKGSDEDLKQELMAAMNGSDSFCEPFTSANTDEQRALEAKVNLLLEREETKIEVGDWVTWKAGLKNKKHPEEGKPVKVIKVLTESSSKKSGIPLYNSKEDSGSPYYGEPLDLVLALLDEDGDLLIYHYDKRRFKVVKKSRIS